VEEGVEGGVDKQHRHLFCFDIRHGGHDAGPLNRAHHNEYLVFVDELFDGFSGAGGHKLIVFNVQDQLFPEQAALRIDIGGIEFHALKNGVPHNSSRPGQRKMGADPYFGLCDTHLTRGCTGKAGKDGQEQGNIFQVFHKKFS